MLRSVWFAFLFLPLVFLQVLPVIADDPLQFNETQWSDVREGYVTLNWNSLPGAAEYQLTVDADNSVYRGPLPQAFVSGLADGSYEYHAAALDKAGNVIATTQVPAVVVVRHWSLQLAGVLFFGGLAVFLVLVGLIILGTQQTRVLSDPPTTGQGEPE